MDNSRLEKVTATAEFDPPVVRPGEKTFYRVTITATQNSIEWPDQISAPAELKFGPSVRGQLMQPDGMPFQPHTEFVYEVTAAAAGNLTVSNFFVPVGGRSVEIPAASRTWIQAPFRNRHENCCWRLRRRTCSSASRSGCV